MAEEHVGPRPERRALWTRIFSAFRIALDAKKLVLAALGILLTACGWWLLAAVFYWLSPLPNWGKSYENADQKSQEQQFASYKKALDRWNLLHELAGPPRSRVAYLPADFAQNYDDFRALQPLYESYTLLSTPVTVRSTDKGLELIADKSYRVTVVQEGDLNAVKDKTFHLADLTIDNPKNSTIRLDNIPLRVEQNFEDLRKYRLQAKDVPELQADTATVENLEERKARMRGISILQSRLLNPGYKPAGKLRTMPWFENRGPNPYLLVADTIKSAGSPQAHALPWPPGQFVSWFFGEEMPVLLEPLFKFLTPVVYLFDRRAGLWECLYLILVILWTLAVWGFFGGAITRIAAVQFARNERITLRDAVMFARERFVSFFAAPVFPLACLFIVTIALILFGFFELIPVFGDILVAGLGWPLVMLAGLVMAVVLVGLVGWPLMYATISTEASDSFDALSRSYSYVYQAPWRYLWYLFVAVAYGAAVVFFITFMASLLVFLGKWGVARTPGMTYFDREPSYLFVYAPTSFHWRDLLISDSPHRVDVAGDAARLSSNFAFDDTYRQSLTWYNKAGAFLVAIWIGAFFLIVLGFSYSFFWTASTIIYFLMRRQVDDTDLDEVHLEADALDDPITKPVVPPPAAPAAPKPNTVSLQMVDPPSLRPTPAPAAPPTQPIDISTPPPAPHMPTNPPPSDLGKRPIPPPDNGEGTQRPPM